ncbi:hypothetical protein ElyMa_002897500 [Elysia marginata]|uniref:Uncharacterized protein n=1 Tax=Elysia marginata TaxID=1093978 RepID=A0AAV4I038_9GAST|nr:hypothetical protein ElyMa_002897500 [Elysia marginata]
MHLANERVEGHVVAPCEEGSPGLVKRQTVSASKDQDAACGMSARGCPGTKGVKGIYYSWGLLAKSGNHFLRTPGSY